MLTDCQKFCIVRKRMKFATKPIWHRPPRLRYVVTIPWEIKNSNFLLIFSICGRKYKQTDSTFVIHPQILIFSVLKIASFSPYWLQIKFSSHCFFTCLLLRSICGTGNSSQQTSLQRLSTVKSTWCSFIIIMPNGSRHSTHNQYNNTENLQKHKI